MDNEVQQNNQQDGQEDAPLLNQVAEVAKISHLPLDKKLELLKKYNNMDNYEEGRYIDALDSVNSWCLAEIQQIDQRTMSIHFDGWSNKWDCFYKMNSFKVAPFRKYSRGYSGQNKIALRKIVFNMDDLFQEKQRVERIVEQDFNNLSAFEITQYIRGKLYIYVDFLLGTNNYSEEQIDAVNDFIQAVLRLIVAWQKKLPKLIPLFSQTKVNPDLFLIDEGISLLFCYWEFYDILKKIFCCCHRCIRYYIHFDKNAIQYDQPVTQSFESVDFIQNRKSIEEEIYGQFVNFVNYYAHIGGFTSLIDAMKISAEVEERIPIELISYLTMAFKNCNSIFSKEFSSNFVNNVKDIVFARIKTMSEKELKEIDKEVVGKVLNDLKEFLTLHLSEAETSELIESHQLWIAYRFLKSTYLEKRLRGLNDIKMIIDRIEAGQKYQKLKNEIAGGRVSRMQDQEMVGHNQIRLQPPKWLTADYLKDWLLKQQVLETVFGENTHLEIVKRSGCLLQFLAKEGALPKQTVDLVWKCQLGKHEEMVRVVYGIIKDLVPHISLEYIDEFHSKILQLNIKQYDEKFLNFLKDFSLRALENYHDTKSNEMSTNENQALDFETRVNNKEMDILQNLQKSLENHSQGLFQENNFYGMPIFWALIQDKSQSVSKELVDFSLSSITEILKQPFSRHLRMPYALKSLENLMKQESLVQSITIIQNIIAEYSTSVGQKYQDTSILTSQNFITMLQSNIQIIEILIKNLKSYSSIVKEKLKQIADKKQSLGQNISEMIFYGRFSHNFTLNKMLEFLDYLIIGSYQQVPLGIQNIETLWQIFVQQPNCNSDQALFLHWVNQDRQEMYSKKEITIFNEEERMHFFTKILCNPTYLDFKKASRSQVQCFHKYFKIINKEQSNIDYLSKRISVHNFQKIVGVDPLWKMALEGDNDKGADESMELLVDLHLKFDQHISIEEQQKVWEQFVVQCMNNLDLQKPKATASIIKLLSKFLDKFEGKRPLRPEFKVSQQLSNISPLIITVFNKNDQASKKQVSVSYFQTLGHLRHKIAEAFDMKLNEFVMSIRNNYIDPEEDDDKYIKDLGMQINQAIIQKNPNYSVENHPKNIISNNQVYFDSLFLILSSEETSLIEPAWNLLNIIPTNLKLSQEISELSGVQENQQNWINIFDPRSAHKMLYCLKIVYGIISPSPQNQQVQQVVDKSVSKKDLKQQQWRQRFLQLGGFQQLLNSFINLEIKKIDTSLSLKCIDLLIMILYEFLSTDKTLLGELINKKDQFFTKAIILIDLITDFNIKQEEKRGDPVEEINKRILATKMKKSKQKSYMSWNKIADKKNQQQQNQNNQEDEDDDENSDSHQISIIYKDFQEQSSVVSSIFRFLQIYILNNDKTSIINLPKYKNIENFLFKAMVRCENWALRSEISRKMKDIICSRSKSEEMQHLLKIVQLMLFEIEKQVTNSYEFRCQIYYDWLSQIIEGLSQEDLIPLQKNIEDLIRNLAKEIIQKEIKEKNTQDQDFLLQGKMKLLKVLIQKFPLMKKPIGENLTLYLLHQCLFEVPHGGKSTKGAPKCKSHNSRNCATRLLDVLCRDCLENLTIVLNYMHNFNENPTWRTNKDHDWNINVRESEKSSTGYVGIKNLGCICYMNSLFQQLFMIPALRNDILGVKNEIQNQNNEEDMLYQLQLLFTGLLKSEKQYINPKGFCHAFRDWEGNPTNVLEQMDVEEFFNMFMDRLETAIKGSPQEKTIQNNFGGKFTHEMICKGCVHTYDRQEPFLSIGVQVKNKKSIIEGLETFIQGDMLDGENAYFCEKCDKKVDTLKRTSIKFLPKYLMVALKRFEFDFDKMIRVKLNDYCEFPLDLNMEPYTQEGLARKEKLAKQQENKESSEEMSTDNSEQILEHKYPKEYYEYTLSGMVVHTGTADSGHYYSFIKDKDHPEYGKWYEMNDMIVRDFDPNDIPSECFGGEEIYQAQQYSQYSNMVMKQDKNVKWRNAYLLFYERKLKEDIILDEEDVIKNKSEQKLSEDIQMNQTSELSEIESKIAFENYKYWQNRFLFGNEYHEFVYNLSLYWNTSNIIPKNYLTKNDDFHLMLNESKPPDYFKDQNMNDPVDVSLNLTKNMDPQKLEEYELQVFKFAASFYIGILQRASNKHFVPTMLNLLKSYMNKNAKCAQWLLSQFCNIQIIEETLLQNSSKEMRKFVVGLLYCAMLKVYPIEKDKINLYWQNNAMVSQSIIANLALILIHNLYELKKFTLYNLQYFQLLARISSLGTEIREFLLKCKVVGRLLDYFFEDASPYRDDFKSMKDINPISNEKPEMGLPTYIDKKQMNYFQELMERRRLKNMMDATQKQKYLLETISNCIRGIKFNNQKSPYALDSISYELQQQENDLFIPDAKFLKKIFAECKKSRSVVAIVKCYCHYSWNDIDHFKELVNTMSQGLNDHDYDEVRPFLILAQFLIQKPSDQFIQKVDFVLRTFLDTIHSNHNFFKYMETMFEFIFKITSRNEQARNWFYNNKNVWSWLIDWLKEFKIPPNPVAQNSNMRLFKRRNANYIQMQNQIYKQDAVKAQAMNAYRVKRMQQILDHSVPDLKDEYDVEISDMQDHKFVVGQFVDQYYRKNDKVLHFVVETVLDEMVYARQVQPNGSMYEGQAYSCWLGCDTDKLLPGQEYKKLVRTKMLDILTAQIENSKQNYNQQQQQMSDEDDSDKDVQ